jgi:glyoxylase-like metal-dependent hydrolase (beta-lactamase superfamily II)
VRALALHADVLVATSAVLQVNCVLVRGPANGGGEPTSEASAERPGEAFVIDSPVLPDELDALPSLLEQARFPAPIGLLATHGDWDHLLGRLAFPAIALGCSELTAVRLVDSPGEPQRNLRRFDEELLLTRQRPLALGDPQALPTPGRCELGEGELELYPTAGHTPDGMAVMIGWAGVLVAGDYLSSAELPTLHDGGNPADYVETLERLRPLLERAHHVVPGHGPVLDSKRALRVLEQDVVYVTALRDGFEAQLPEGRSGTVQRELHAKNLAVLSSSQPGS